MSLCLYMYITVYPPGTTHITHVKLIRYTLCYHSHPHQVLDSSREDWWLVLPMAMTEEESSGDPPKEGWVPANHLEKLISGII